ncbi:TonB-dependent receptor [Membranihabitans marinus]
MLTEAIQQISRKYQVLFSYDRAWVDNIVVEYNETTTDNLEDALEFILSQANLAYQIFDDRYVAVYRDTDEGMASLQKMVEHFQGIVDHREMMRKRQVEALAPIHSVSTKDLYNKRLVINVTGKVVNQLGEPLIGVNVLVKGRNLGIATDFNGVFSLQDVDENAVLVFSYIGYQTKEVSLAGKTEINITLIEDSETLDEVVVVGYGTLQSRDVTGSMSTISDEKLNGLQVTSVTEALAGLSAGLQVNQISGEPGVAPSIRIRGVGSLTAGNEPLIVIDGFPTEGTAIANININDIESISTLKDASSTAIYGSRGANGVILITTKKGLVGKPKISFNNSFALSSIAKKIDVLSPEEYVDFAVDAVNRAWEYLGNDKNDPFETRPTFYQVPQYFLEPDSWARTDWQDEIYQTAPIYDHQLSISGGNEDLRYRVSGGFLNQDGIIKSSDFKRYTLGLNLDGSLTDKLGFSLVLNTSKVDKNVVETFHQWNQGVVATAIALPGFYDVINEDGSYPGHAGMGFNTSAVRNPMMFINEYDRQVFENRILGSMSLSYEIFKGLNLKTQFGIDNQDNRNEFFRNNITFDVPASSTHSRNTYNGAGTHGASSSFDWLSETTLNFNHSWSNHHRIDAILGFTAQKAVLNNGFISADNFPDNLVPTLNAGQIASGNTTKSEFSMLSYLSRINYSFKGKYLTTLTLRRDGSSRFGSENRWGYFPSTSFGWIISEEDFVEKSAFMNYLKLKASYGVSGNNTIPNYGSAGLLSYTNYVLGNNILTGQIPSSLSNYDLGWETSKQFNLGIEYNLLNNRVKVLADVYHSVNDNLLLNVPVPSILGVNTALQNIGKIQNRGIEFNITTENITGDFNWTTDLNFSLNRNKVLELGPEGTPIYANTYQSETNVTQIGRPIGDFYGYVFDGVYNSQEEIESRPSLSTDRPGDPIVVDVNGDGEITADDRTSIGNYQPDFYFGLDNTFRYKNIDLRVLLHGVQGASVMDLIFYQAMALTGRTNSLGLARERWRSPEEPGNGEVYAASIDVRGVRRRPSTFYIQDASYLRIKNITLGYSLNQNMIEKASLSGARIYLSAQNLFTFTSYHGYNPEVSSYNNSALTAGVNYYGYPTSKSITIGLNINF